MNHTVPGLFSVIPRIIHMVYFPWDKNQKLLADCHAFDHQPFERMVRYAPGFDVRLWTLDQARDVVQENAPELWRLMISLARPTMMVDVFRWWLIHHFGGIYWQYDMNPLVAMDRLLPRPGKKVRLFTENVNDTAFCQSMAAEPIRGGEPEEPVRLCNQVFAAEPGRRFIQSVLDTIVDRSSRLTPRRDYDILYICANAAVSTVYDKTGKTDPEVELMDRAETRRMVKLQYKGTWRTENSVKGLRLKVEGRGEKRSWLKRTIKRMPGYYRIRRHVHENAGLVDVSVVPPAWSSWPVDSTCTSVAVFPYWPAWESIIPLGTFSRVRRLSLTRQPPVGAEHFNPMVMRWPRVDLVVCLDYLERLPDADVKQVFAGIRERGVRYVMLSHHPELNNNWDTALGDYRPVNWSLSPWSLGEPVWTTAWPNTDGRPDRVAAIWALT
ncbi:MAG TPA: hypothetical protein PKE26_06230 [Kiritimatiellia bacterium]|nr:hypothetical protein [Kiritimatiellia bacterium]HMO98690.1 hypothetical protein [Kiritimatiellia bacterium]